MTNGALLMRPRPHGVGVQEVTVQSTDLSVTKNLDSRRLTPGEELGREKGVVSSSGVLKSTLRSGKERREDQGDASPRSGEV